MLRQAALPRVVQAARALQRMAAGEVDIRGGADVGHLVGGAHGGAVLEPVEQLLDPAEEFLPDAVLSQQSRLGCGGPQGRPGADD